MEKSRIGALHSNAGLAGLEHWVLTVEKGWIGALQDWRDWSTVQNTVEQPASMHSLAFQKEKKAFLSLSNRNELLLKVAM